MIQNGPDENWKTTVLYFLHEVDDVVRLSVDIVKVDALLVQKNPKRHFLEILEIPSMS